MKCPSASRLQAQQLSDVLVLTVMQRKCLGVRMLLIILVNSPWKLLRNVYFGEKAVFQSSKLFLKLHQCPAILILVAEIILP